MEHTPIPWRKPDNHFVPLHVPIKKTKAQADGYRVFTSKTEFVDVQASTIAEALEKSGVNEPLKIERLGLVTISIYHDDDLLKISGYGNEQRMVQAMSATQNSEAQKRKIASHDDLDASLLASIAEELKAQHNDIPLSTPIP